MTSQQQTFGAWLRSKRLDARLTMDELAKKAKVSKQYLSVLERAAPHALTGKPVTPKVVVVDRLAAALRADQDDARTLAGYAPVHTFQKPETLEQFLSILQAIGVEVQNFHAPPFNDSPEFYHALLEDLAKFVEFRLFTPPSRTFSLGDADEGQPEDPRRESPPLAHFPERRHKAG